MSKLFLYGIPNCDTVKKARVWLQEQGREFTFVDFKKIPPDAALLHSWLAQAAHEQLINRKGTTWRGLSDDEKNAVCDAASAASLMQHKPSVIKRPVLIDDGKLLALGFSAQQYAELFSAK
ncbi:ArsC family reductase [Massilia sp. W12]|uniref:ArsC family reductase n=1 Tax=Massilia sp. W12 TaxID=3126507 RepID=UPI0030CFED70